jgi:hypothetical protein
VINTNHRGFSMSHKNTCIITVLLVALLLLVQGCASPSRLEAVPTQDMTRAEIPGIPNARYWVESDIETFVNDALASFKREQAFLARTGHQHQGELPPVSFLAISGGGDDGAFGAGLLVGWTETGSRPEFKAVTGISTGALIAPFAFLGPDYDDKLRAVYTTIGPSDVLKPRGLIAALTSDGMADNRPLYELIARYIDSEMLARIASEYNDKGRLLLISTTNLDARRPVIWNMGAIASSSDPRATDLFHRIMLASAAIPGAFPPTMIDVEVDGKTYQEMHVDGGAMAQVFLYPPRLFDIARQRGFKAPEREREAYIIRNARLDPDWASVERNTLSIVGRAISSLIQTQGIGDLYKIYLTTQHDGLDFNLAYIGAEFNHERKEDFDNAYMQALFEYGYELGRKGYTWQKTPPGLTVSNNQ